jgi:Tol biopolymer transport system component
VRSAASWSSDGTWVAVGGDEGNGSRVFKIPVAGGPPVRIVDKLSYNPVWSPNGRLILYSEAIVGVFHPVKAVTPEGKPVSLPDARVLGMTESYRFLPNSESVVLLQGFFRSQNFWLLDLGTGHRRQLTNLRQTAAIKSFDVSPDGKEIIFDRSNENSDIVLIEIPKHG